MQDFHPGPPSLHRLMQASSLNRQGMNFKVTKAQRRFPVHMQLVESQTVVANGPNEFGHLHWNPTIKRVPGLHNKCFFSS